MPTDPTADDSARDDSHPPACDLPTDPVPAPTEREIVAYHEAGHAAASLALGRPLARVSIVYDPATDSRGRCTPLYLGAAALTMPHTPRTGHAREPLECDAVISLAGPLAEMLFRGEPETLDAESDYTHAAEVALKLAPRAAEAQAVLDRLHDRAAALLRVPAVWRAVRAIAGALLAAEFGEISGERAAELWRAEAEAAARTPPRA